MIRQKLLLLIVTLTSVVVLSCGGTKKSSEAVTPVVTNLNEHPADSSANKAVADRERVESKESWLGSEIVAESTGRLTNKLSLNSNTTKKVGDIITSAFMGIGGELSKTYSVKEAREMGKKIIRNSVDPIMVILDENQKTEFKKLLQN